MVNYADMKFPTPSKFKDTFVGKSVLIIGTGMSTKKLVPYKNKLSENFDAIIGLNFCTIDFEEQLTHHLLIEKKPVASYTDMKKNPSKYRKDLPRILNFKGIHRFPKYLNIFKATRTNFGGKPNIREYVHNGCEGLMNGSISPEGFSLGSVALQGLHLACILGCTKVYIAGVDLVFGKKFDHYYEDRFYRDNRKEIHKSKIIKVKHGGQTYETTKYFNNSAQYIDQVVNNMCTPKGIKVYSFSDGLLKAPIKLDIDKFFKGK